MRTITWERGVMRYWIALNVIPACVALVVLVAAYNFGSTQMPIEVFGLFLFVGIGELIVSWVAIRLVIWIVRGFIGPPRAPAP